MPEIEGLLRRARRLEIKARRASEGLLAGGYRSVFRGRGIEFAEVREYVPGDDVRAIDWNVTARMGRCFVKEFVEERDLEVYIALDASGSSEFGSGKSKWELGCEIAASLILSALRSNDSVGLCLFSDEVERFIEAGKGRRHGLRLIRELVAHELNGRRTDIALALQWLSRVLKRRSLLFVLSDFMAEGYVRPLRALLAKHEVLLIRLFDPLEEELPEMGYAFVEDCETGEQMLVDTSDAGFRKRFAETARAARAGFEEEMRRLGVEAVHVCTHEPFYLPLYRFMRERRRRMRW